MMEMEILSSGYTKEEDCFDFKYLLYSVIVLLIITIHDLHCALFSFVTMRSRFKTAIT